MSVGVCVWGGGTVGRDMWLREAGEVCVFRGGGAQAGAWLCVSGRVWPRSQIWWVGIQVGLGAAKSEGSWHLPYLTIWQVSLC